jgi:nucleoside-diphosphate-sugar epimerase
MADGASIAITGATGFIGSALAQHFAARGWRVIALSRRPPQASASVEHRAYDLQRPPPGDLLTGVECLVHAAFVAGDYRTNVRGSRALLEASRRQRVSRLVFLSSLSARSDARSKYGRQKFEIEQLFEGASGANLRLGVVLGQGGLFERTSDHLRKRGRIPLIDGGLQPLQLVTLAEVLAAVENVFARRLAGTFAIADPTPIAYRDFYAQLCARLGVRPRFVRVPSALLLAVLEACERLRIRLPITTENVWGLKQARVIDTAPDLAAVGVRVGSAEEWLHR